MINIHGVGKVKQKITKEFYKLISRYVADNEIVVKNLI
jgi:hypothetical protein